jgi:F0F1-type ATP synthase assembly protein I
VEASSDHPKAMSHVVGRGKRLVLRIAVAQLCCTLVMTILCALLSGASAAGAASAGGLIAVTGSAVFGWRVFAPGIASAPTLARAMYVGEALKWLWIVVAVWACLALFKFAGGPLLLGLIVAQFGYWLGLIRARD